MLSVRFKLFLINYLEVSLQTQFRAESKVSSMLLLSHTQTVIQALADPAYILCLCCRKKSGWKYQRQGLPVKLVLCFHQIKLKDSNIV